MTISVSSLSQSDCSSITFDFFFVFSSNCHVTPCPWTSNHPHLHVLSWSLILPSCSNFSRKSLVPFNWQKVLKRESLLLPQVKSALILLRFAGVKACASLPGSGTELRLGSTDSLPCFLLTVSHLSSSGEGVYTLSSPFERRFRWSPDLSSSFSGSSSYTNCFLKSFSSSTAAVVLRPSHRFRPLEFDPDLPSSSDGEFGLGFWFLPRWRVFRFHFVTDQRSRCLIRLDDLMWHNSSAGIATPVLIFEDSSTTPLFVQTLLWTRDCFPVIFLHPLGSILHLNKSSPSSSEITKRNWITDYEVSCGDGSILSCGSQVPSHHHLHKQKSQQKTGCIQSVHVATRNFVHQEFWSTLHSCTKRCLGRA